MKGKSVAGIKIIFRHSGLIMAPVVLGTRTKADHFAELSRVPGQIEKHPAVFAAEAGRSARHAVRPHRGIVDHDIEPLRLQEIANRGVVRQIQLAPARRGHIVALLQLLGEVSPDKT
jgi:hypothetical protein